MLTRWIWRCARQVRSRPLKAATAFPGRRIDFSLRTQAILQQSRGLQQAVERRLDEEEHYSDEAMPRQPLSRPPRALDALQTVLGLSTSDKAAAKTADDVVFVCVDCEAFEHDQSKITEIGISVFDTRDIAGVPPGSAWLNCIRSAHFRPVEHALLRNRSYAVGDPDGFKFGRSTWIHLRDVPELFERLLLDPANLDQVAHFAVRPASQGRKIILIGHNVKSDLKFLQTVGVDLRSPHSTIVRTFDTQALAGGTKKASPSLKRVLFGVNIEPASLHNAGNDAAYTLLASLMMALKEHREGPGSVAAGLAEDSPVLSQAPLAVSSGARSWGGSAKLSSLATLNARQRSRVKSIMRRGGMLVKTSDATRAEMLRDAYHLVCEVGPAALELQVHAHLPRLHRQNHSSSRAKTEERGQQQPEVQHDELCVENQQQQDTKRSMT